MKQEAESNYSAAGYGRVMQGISHLLKIKRII